MYQFPFGLYLNQILFKFDLFFSEVKPCNRFNLKNLNILKGDFEG
jgi:hypothetical protein